MSNFRADYVRCIPVLASLSIDESHNFYVNARLHRCRLPGTQRLIVRRDQMEIHFRLAEDRIHPEHTSCYIRGGHVVALYEEFSKRSVPQLSSFEVRSWNMKEFYTFDPHGDLLRFGCAPEEVGDAPFQGKQKAQ